ncbi:MAG: hypothetical protein EXR83_01775 [Gammaproteobacteria bacterium]|nr:hypothetical protein [Gammaproteobacteria bacterium]
MLGRVHPRHAAPRWLVSVAGYRSDDDPGWAGQPPRHRLVGGPWPAGPPDPAAVWSVRWELSYLSVAGVLVGMLAWNFGTRRVGPLNATLFINFMPVMTFAFRGLQGYRFAAIELLGATLVVAALVANNLYLRAKYLRRLAAPSV